MRHGKAECEPGPPFSAAEVGRHDPPLTPFNTPCFHRSRSKIESSNLLTSPLLLSLHSYPPYPVPPAWAIEGAVEGTTAAIMSSSLVLSSKSLRKNRLGTNSSLPPREELDRALDAFENELLKSKGDGGLAARFKNLRGVGKLPDLTDVVRLTEEMSNDCAARHGGWRQYALRLTPFFERIRQFASIGDVLVGGAQNMIASGVWAAVRLAVEVMTPARHAARFAQRN